MVEANKYKLEVGDKIKYKNRVYTILFIEEAEYVVLDKECNDCNKSRNLWENWYPMLEWNRLDYATKIERKIKSMDERLQELKEKITAFVNDYNIESFDVYIDELASDVKSSKKYYKVNLEIRV